MWIQERETPGVARDGLEGERGAGAAAVRLRGTQSDHAGQRADDEPLLDGCVVEDELDLPHSRAAQRRDRIARDDPLVGLPRFLGRWVRLAVRRAVVRIADLDVVRQRARASATRRSVFRLMGLPGMAGQTWLS